MILGIDASNIRGGGTINHLVELLRAAEPTAHGFTQVFVWSGRRTLDRIDDRPWLVKCHHPSLDQGLLHRSSWQRFRLSAAARQARCDVLFVPGGSFAGTFRPVLTMSQNLLPFEWTELRRFGWSWMTLKLLLLRVINTRTFRQADGIIFLTPYARDVITRVIGRSAANTKIVPLGVGQRFVHSPREQQPVEQYSADHPFRLIYVSTVDMYKHQQELADAVAQLRRAGMWVTLDLIGSAYPPALAGLRSTLDRVDPAGECVQYVGEVPYDTLHTRYADADACVFASSCENMPNILLEGMASGLPIACSDRGPMPGMLGDGGLYFDPESPSDIASTLRALICAPDVRTQRARIAFDRAHEYSWTRCATETFDFLAHIGREFAR